MQELKVIKVDRLDPNPFRDGSGGTPPATWETVTEVYGFDEDKLKELQQSYEINGVWAGVHVRPSGSRYQLAFGHHRIEAARRMGLKAIPVVVAELGDDEMVRMMASENSEEYGHDFALGVMNAVEAVVKAYGSGAINVDPPEPSGYGRFGGRRSAPSFVVDEVSKDITHPYTAQGVASYLGWTIQRTDRDGVAADKKTMAALSALELIELGALKRSQFKGLGASQARELISITKRGMEAEKVKQEQQQEFLEKARVKAVQEDDKNKASSLKRQLDRLTNEKAEHIKNAARAVASSVVSFHKESESFSEAARKAAEAHKLPEKVAPKKKLPLDGTYVENFTAKLDDVLLDSDASLARIVEFSYLLKARKPFRDLADSMDRLAERARLRAKELRKVIG
jgi:hypothetical protein